MTGRRIVRGPQLRQLHGSMLRRGETAETTVAFLLDSGHSFLAWCDAIEYPGEGTNMHHLVITLVRERRQVMAAYDPRIQQGVVLRPS